MLNFWGAEPDLWSGVAEEDLAGYKAWLTERAIWAAMTRGQDEDDPGQDAPA